jgi:uncharacterized protein
MFSRRYFLFAAGSAVAFPTRDVFAAPAISEPWVEKLLAAAVAQVGVTTRYVPAYQQIPYPNGDVLREGGVCTDVVIRAYRDAFGCDLQRLVHEDMAAHFDAYPKKWGLNHPDANIDHRRVGNLQVFFRRHGDVLLVTQNAADYAPGDIYTCLLPGNLPHIGLVDAQRSPDGLRPLIINNIGEGTQVEDRLFEFPLTGHFRYAPSV